MQLELRKHVADALAAAQRIIDFMRGKDLVAYLIRFRNLLVHGCDVVSHEVVWDIVQKDVDQLRELEQLLGSP